MQPKKLYEIIKSEFYTGVPDSKLKALSTFLMMKYGLHKNHHIIAANEGNAVGLGAGYYLATKKIPVVYMQNSGEGNAVNPIASLLNDKVYGIPMVFIIGWRGEPGVKDEPQHIFQGEITLKLLEDLDIKYFIIDKNTKDEEVKSAMDKFDNLLSKGKQVAFVVKKDGLNIDVNTEYKNEYKIEREEAIRNILKYVKDDIIVSTTGKISRELYELRDENNEMHKNDFLTVGSMGHASSIALSIALNKKDKKVWCLDGDGAVIMHMGAMATIGKYKPNNLIHIVLNNEAHESVGGMPTTNNKTDFSKIANACGYEKVFTTSDKKELDSILKEAEKNNSLTFIEIKCSIISRADLGRPKTTAKENLENFMNSINKK